MTMTDRRQLLAMAAAGGASTMFPTLSSAQSADPLMTVDVAGDIAPRDLRLVHGRPPAGLGGVLYRNGPGCFRRGSTTGHWFDGDGLIRRFAIEGGKASLAARFVDTAKRRQETAADRMMLPGFGSLADPDVVVTSPDDANAANTSVMMAGNELWALWEGGGPTAIDPDTLATRGIKTLREDLKSIPFTAHPRVEPDGRVWNLGSARNRAIVWRLAANGVLEAAEFIDLPRAAYIHDFTATARHLIIVLQPWVFESSRLPMVDAMAWKPALGTQILVLDKDDLSRRRLFETEPFFFFHAGDAWEEADGTLRFDICAYPDPAFAIEGGRRILVGDTPVGEGAKLAMTALHPDGRTTLARTGVAAEFPRSDTRLAGRARSRTVHTADRGLGVYDWKTQREIRHDFGARQQAEEFLFVPRPGGAGETDGWLVGTTLNLAARATELHVFDANRIDAGPLATWRADIALPIGFHGLFKQNDRA